MSNFEEFKIGTKVFLDGEYGVVVDLKKHENSWCSMWLSFVQMGGKLIDQNYQFTYINDDGSVKDKI
ncbi:hypothetical protein ACN9MN_07195 [Chryseobacterium sp. S-02]|uniref:hypothetical protein n=1 Tax=Chryseobacterium sp. S-02 TaxID=3404064 RepID=UPI003CF65726